MDYTLTRSKRKTAVIYVRDRGVEVRAPLKMPKSDIDRFVASKEKWLIDRLAKLQEQSEKRRIFTLDYGARILYRGEEYPIVPKNGNYVGFEDRFYMPPDLPPEQIKASCIKIYRMLAKHSLTEKVLAFAKQMSVMPRAVKINGAKTRWGSCSGKNSINFSWRLIMADDAVIDYVVVHELAHIKEHNHSDRFWAIVASVLPDYKTRQVQLKELQKRLERENWEENA